MRNMRAGLALTLVCVGCTHGQPWSDYKETPIIERGACATVVMPGEQVPLGSQPNCPGGYSSIGGATVYDEKDYQKGTKPGAVARGVAGALGAPVAAGAAAAQRITGNGRQQQSDSRGTGDREQSEIDRMRREIMQRERMGAGQAQQAAPAPVSAPAPSTPQQLASRTAHAPTPSIADELAALRGASATQPAPAGETLSPLTSAPGSAPLPAPAAERPRPAAEAAVADRVADRDGDGAPDHWIYRDASGRPVREQFDENGDARPDRTAWLDPETGAELRAEDDANLDGRVDTWLEYAGGAVSRQRRDTNYDGIPDVWAYYGSDGKLSRQEADLDGDGYRNRESIYRAGKLAKEREDRDGDGRFDLVTLYDADERIARRDEDRDGDGKIDTRSIYQGGKLARREVVAEALDDGDELSQTEW